MSLPAEYRVLWQTDVEPMFEVARKALVDAWYAQGGEVAHYTLRQDLRDTGLYQHKSGTPEHPMLVMAQLISVRRTTPEQMNDWLIHQGIDQVIHLHHTTDTPMGLRWEDGPRHAFMAHLHALVATGRCPMVWHEGTDTQTDLVPQLIGAVVARDAQKKAQALTELLDGGGVVRGRPRL